MTRWQTVYPMQHYWLGIGLCSIALPSGLAQSPTAQTESREHQYFLHGTPICGVVDPLSTERYTIVGTDTWIGSGSPPRIGPAFIAQGVELTFSFAPDGTPWGYIETDDYVAIPAALGAAEPSDLQRYLVLIFDDIDLSREYIRQSIASWAAWSSLALAEVADSGNQLTDSIGVSGDGELRYGGIIYPSGPNNLGFLALATTPTEVAINQEPGAKLRRAGGDVVINTDQEDVAFDFYSSTTNDYRFLRNTFAHEMGHQLGARHFVPIFSPDCAPFGQSNSQAMLMDSSPQPDIDLVQIDEIRLSQRLFGDRYSGNNSAATAHFIGDLAGRSILERNLSTNGTNGPSGTDQDWFSFTLTSATNLTLSADPVRVFLSNVFPSQEGYHNLPGSGLTFPGNCNPGNFFNLVRGASAGDLSIELWKDTGSGLVLVENSDTGAPGDLEIISVNLGPGDYLICIRDEGPNADQYQVVQLYDFEVRNGSISAPPFAKCGLDKRIPVGEPCKFIGDILSEPNDIGATLNNNSYDWDLDGNGSFETLDNPRPVHTYSSVGDVTVTLRLTDSNGMSDTDSITVTVYEGPVIDEIVNATSPTIPTGFLWRDRKTPIIIRGDRLNEFNNVQQLIPHIENIEVCGTPVVMNNGTEVHGLFVTASSPASCASLKASVTTSLGFGSLDDALTVTLLADVDGNCVVDTADLGRVIGDFGLTGKGLRSDLNGDEIVDTADTGILISYFYDTCTADCN